MGSRTTNAIWNAHEPYIIPINRPAVHWLAEVGKILAFADPASLDCCVPRFDGVHAVRNGSVPPQERAHPGPDRPLVSDRSMDGNGYGIGTLNEWHAGEFGPHGGRAARSGREHRRTARAPRTSKAGSKSRRPDHLRGLRRGESVSPIVRDGHCRNRKVFRRVQAQTRVKCRDPRLQSARCSVCP
jgi:hypothetical protein